MRVPATFPHLRRNVPFSTWFTGSRVVDQRGEPLRVFHGTDSSFENFAFTNDVGFHFGSLSTAEARLKQTTDSMDAEFDIGANIRPVVLSLRNPLRVSDSFCWDPDEVTRILFDVGVLSHSERKEAEIVDRDFVAARMARVGYDGFVYTNETEKGGDSWIALWPQQVRPWWVATQSRK